MKEAMKRYGIFGRNGETEKWRRGEMMKGEKRRRGKRGMLGKVLLGIGLIVLPGVLSAQVSGKWGTISGSLESNSIYYMKDSKLGDVRPDDHFGSNNYLKFDYRIGKFSAGLQYEAYLPVLQGFPVALKDADIVHKYAAFEDENLSVLAGDFYEQFGSGLIFRAYEERSLGLNTSIEGVRGTYSFGGKARIRALWGRPRLFMEHAKSQVRGADLSLDLGQIMGFGALGLMLEGSYLNRYQEYTGTNTEISPNVDAWSGRLAFELGGFSFKGEYATKGKEPLYTNGKVIERGEAILAELGYVGGGFGGLLTFRRLKHMTFRSTREGVGIGDDLNYLPALTRQYTYLLTNLNPYNTQSEGEFGGQADLYYNLPKGSWLAGKYGMKVGVNFSTYYDLKGDLVDGYDFGPGKELLFRDLSVDLVKTFSRSFKMTLLYSMQDFNPIVTGHPSADYKSNIVVGDFTYKITPKNSLRLEVQHLWTEQDQKNWAAALLEFNMAPRWSIFASDMYNYGDTDMHYYNGGVSWSKSRSRIALNYGRNRAGYTCAGGICRMIPAYTGFNLQLTTAF